MQPFITKFLSFIDTVGYDTSIALSTDPREIKPFEEIYFIEEKKLEKFWPSFSIF